MARPKSLTEIVVPLSTRIKLDTAQRLDAFCAPDKENIKGKNILYNKIILLFHFQSFRNPVIYFLWRYMQTSLDLETKM